MIPPWNELPPATREKLKALVETVEVNEDDLVEIEDLMVIGERLAEMIVIELYTAMRHMINHNV